MADPIVLSPALTSDEILADRRVNPPLRSTPRASPQLKTSSSGSKLRERAIQQGTPRSSTEAGGRLLRHVKSSIASGEGEGKLHTWIEFPPSMEDVDGSLQARSGSNRTPEPKTRQQTLPPHVRVRTTSAAAPASSFKARDLLAPKRWSALLNLRNSKETSTSRSSSPKIANSRAHADGQSSTGGTFEISAPYAVTAAPDSALAVAAYAAACGDGMQHGQSILQPHAPRHGWPEPRLDTGRQGWESASSSVAFAAPASTTMTRLHSFTSEAYALATTGAAVGSLSAGSPRLIKPFDESQQQARARATSHEPQSPSFRMPSDSNGQRRPTPGLVPPGRAATAASSRALVGEDAYLSIAVGEPSEQNVAEAAIDGSFGSEQLWATPVLDGGRTSEGSDSSTPLMAYERFCMTPPWHEPGAHSSPRLHISCLSPDVRHVAHRRLAMYSSIAPTQMQEQEETWPMSASATHFSGLQLDLGHDSSSSTSPVFPEGETDASRRARLQAWRHHDRFKQDYESAHLAAQPDTKTHEATAASRRPTHRIEPQSVRICAKEDEKTGRRDRAFSESTQRTSLSEPDFDAVEIRTAWRSNLADIGGARTPPPMYYCQRRPWAAATNSADGSLWQQEQQQTPSQYSRSSRRLI